MSQIKNSLNDLNDFFINRNLVQGFLKFVLLYFFSLLLSFPSKHEADSGKLYCSYFHFSCRNHIRILYGVLF